MSKTLCRLLLLALPLGTAPALADPAAHRMARSVSILQVGVLCDSNDYTREQAPQTQTGSVRVYDGHPRFVTDRQAVPALPGIIFGVKFIVTRDVPKLRYMISTPSWNRRDVWKSWVWANDDSYHYFIQDADLVPELGIYTLEAWDGDDRLYAVEFEVVPASQMPDVSSKCDLVS